MILQEIIKSQDEFKNKTPKTNYKEASVKKKNIIISKKSKREPKLTKPSGFSLESILQMLWE